MDLRICICEQKWVWINQKYALFRVTFLRGQMKFRSLKSRLPPIISCKFGLRSRIILHTVENIVSSARLNIVAVSRLFNIPTSGIQNKRDHADRISFLRCFDSKIGQSSWTKRHTVQFTQKSDFNVTRVIILEQGFQGNQLNSIPTQLP